MVQPETFVLEDKSQALRNRLRSMDGDLQREIANRRRPGRAAKVYAGLLPLLRGEAVLYRRLSDEIDPPYGLEHATPRFPLALYLILVTPQLGVLGLVTWAMLR